MEGTLDGVDPLSSLMAADRYAERLVVRGSRNQARPCNVRGHQIMKRETKFEVHGEYCSTVIPNIEISVKANTIGEDSPYSNSLKAQYLIERAIHKILVDYFRPNKIKCTSEDKK